MEMKKIFILCPYFTLSLLSLVIKGTSSSTVDTQMFLSLNYYGKTIYNRIIKRNFCGINAATGPWHNRYAIFGGFTSVSSPKKISLFIILQGFFTYNLCESFYGLEQIIKNFVCWKSQCIFNLCIKRIKLPKTLTRQLVQQNYLTIWGLFG